MLPSAAWIFPAEWSGSEGPVESPLRARVVAPSSVTPSSVIPLPPFAATAAVILQFVAGAVVAAAVVQLPDVTAPSLVPPIVAGAGQAAGRGEPGH